MQHTAIILRTDPFRESDRVVTLFSLEHGLVRLIAKGTQKITSKNAPALEPCTLAMVGEAAGKELSYITSVQPEKTYSGIRTDLLKSAAGLYVSHLLAKLLKEQDPHTALWQDTVAWLEVFDTAPFQLRFIDAYVFRMLAALGFEPDLSGEGIALSISDGTVVDTNRARTLIQEKKQVIKVDADIVRMLQAFISADWETIAGLSIPTHQVATIHRIIFEYARYHLERDIADWERVIHSFE